MRNTISEHICKILYVFLILFISNSISIFLKSSDIQSVKHAASMSIVNRIQQINFDQNISFRGEQQQISGWIQNNENVNMKSEVNQQSQEDLNKLRDMLQMIQTQQILANSGASISPQLDLNALVSNQIMLMQQNEVNQGASNHLNSTPEVIKIATQKQLSDLIDVLNQNAEVNRKIQKERVKKED